MLRILRTSGIPAKKLAVATALVGASLAVPAAAFACSVDSMNVTASGTDINIAGGGSCGGGVRATRILVDGNPLYELGAPQASTVWHAAGASGTHTITVQVAEWGDNNWSRAAARSATVTFNSESSAQSATPARSQAPYASGYEGALVKGSADRVWLLQGGQRHWVPNPDTLNALQGQGHPYYSFSDNDINRIPRGSDIPAVQPPPSAPSQPRPAYPSQYEGALVKGSADPVWLLQAGQRHWVPNPDTLNALQRQGHSYYSFSDNDINRIPRGSDVPAVQAPAPAASQPRPSAPSQPGGGTGSSNGSGVGVVPGSARLNVPYITQIWPGNTIVQNSSGQVIGTAETGLDNCGPASVAMAIQYYRGTGAIDLDGAALGVRGRPNSNVYVRGSGAINGPTNPFGGADGSRTSALLGSFGLRSTPVASLSDIESQVSNGHPVIMLVDSTKYIVNGLPELSSWFFGGQRHIVVVTGYGSSHIYINDPLAPNVGSNFPINMNRFMQGAILGMAVTN